MQLWGIDIVGGIQLVNPVTGELREAKIVTGIDDHSRFYAMATVVERATARAVCLGVRAGAGRYGVPEEVITDYGKQFTDRSKAGDSVAGHVEDVTFPVLLRHGDHGRPLLDCAGAPRRSGVADKAVARLQRKVL